MREGASRREQVRAGASRSGARRRETAGEGANRWETAGEERGARLALHVAESLLEGLGGGALELQRLQGMIGRVSEAKG